MAPTTPSLPPPRSTLRRQPPAILTDAHQPPSRLEGVGVQAQDAENRDGDGTHDHSNSTVKTDSTVGTKHYVDRTKNMSMTYIDICAGCGSMSMAAEEL